MHYVVSNRLVDCCGDVVRYAVMILFVSFCFGFFYIFEGMRSVWTVNLYVLLRFHFNGLNKWKWIDLGIEDIYSRVNAFVDGGLSVCNIISR